MRQKQTGRQSSSERIIKDIKRRTRKQYSAEEKIFALCWMDCVAKQNAKRWTRSQVDSDVEFGSF